MFAIFVNSDFTVNKMNDLKILQLISNISEKPPACEEDGSVKELFKVVPSCADQISKNFSDFIYNTSTVPLANPWRLNVLKWCSHCGKHFQVDNYNYNCFISCLIDGPHKNHNAESVHPEEAFIKSRNAHSVLTWCNNVAKINAKKYKLSNFVWEKDYRRCGNDNNFSPKVFGVKKLDLSALENRLGSNGETQKVSELGSQDVESRRQTINVGYSLLILNNTCEDNKLLMTIINELSTYGKLHDYEQSFIAYLWKNYENFNLPVEIPILLIRNFSFIYEKVTIKLCTGILCETSIVQHQMELEKIVKLLEQTGKSHLVLCHVKDILYQLYACSGYNQKLLSYIHDNNCI